MFYMLNSVFQEPSSPMMEGIMDLHNYILYYMILVIVVVFWELCYVVVLDQSATFPNTVLELKSSYFMVNSIMSTENEVMEIIWTIVPTLILVLMVVPSFALLYAMDEVVGPSLILKVMGHQWYWSYEYDPFVYFEYMEDNKNSVY